MDTLENDGVGFSSSVLEPLIAYEKAPSLPCRIRRTHHSPWCRRKPKRTQQTFRATMLSERQPGTSESLWMLNATKINMTFKQELFGWKLAPPKKNSPPQKTGQVLTTWLGLSKSSKNQGFPFTDILPWHWDLRFFGLRDVTNSNGHWEGSLLGLQLNDSSTWAPKMTCDFHPKFATSPLICFFSSVCSNVLPRDDSCCCYIQRRHSLLRRERTAFGRSQKSDSYPPGEVARAWPVDSYSPENEPGNHPEMKRKLIWTKPPFWVPFFYFQVAHVYNACWPKKRWLADFCDGVPSLQDTNNFCAKKNTKMSQKLKINVPSIIDFTQRKKHLKNI